MKIVHLLFSLTLGISSFAQQFEMPAEQYPFYSIVEWKGMGAMLLSKDPLQNSKKINLTLAGNATTSIWQQGFNPDDKDFYYISSENARYVYFMDNLQLQEGKTFFHQLNSNGNVKSTSVSLGAAIKKLGAFDPLELELMDIVTTDKALVHVFRYHDVKAKKYVEIATFITHHNMLPYSAILGEVSELSLKEGNYGMWKYVGFTDDQIVFAARDFQNKKNGWSVMNFTSKGVMSEAKFIEGPTDKFDFVEDVALGSHGQLYTQQNAKDQRETAQLHFHKNTYYLTGISTDANGRTAKLMELNTGKWVQLNTATLALEKTKDLPTVGTMVLNEGIACKIGNTAVLLPFISSVKPIIQSFNVDMHANPSRMILEEKKELFAVSLAEGRLFFDRKQLGKAGSVKFEFIKK
ncbi:MAG: hypothetical protein RLZ33_2460 [Bacteroidota bacterium]|jgi:hypothetical protein